MYDLETQPANIGRDVLVLLSVVERTALCRCWLFVGSHGEDRGISKGNLPCCNRGRSNHNDSTTRFQIPVVTKQSQVIVLVRGWVVGGRRKKELG